MGYIMVWLKPLKRLSRCRAKLAERKRKNFGSKLLNNVKTFVAASSDET